MAAGGRLAQGWLAARPRVERVRVLALARLEQQAQHRPPKPEWVEDTAAIVDSKQSLQKRSGQGTRPPSVRAHGGAMARRSAPTAAPKPRSTRQASYRACYQVQRSRGLIAPGPPTRMRAGTGPPVPISRQCMPNNRSCQCIACPHPITVLDLFTHKNEIRRLEPGQVRDGAHELTHLDRLEAVLQVG